MEGGTVWRGSDAAGALCDTKRPLTFSSGPGVSPKLTSGRPVAAQTSPMKWVFLGQTMAVVLPPSLQQTSLNIKKS